MAQPLPESGPPELAVDRAPGGARTLRLAGSWTLRDPLPAPDPVLEAVAEEGVRRVSVDARGVTDWDSGLLTFLRPVLAAAREAGAETDPSGLPAGARRLLELAAAAPERAAPEPAPPPGPVTRVGGATLELLRGARAQVTFLGELGRAAARFATGRARYRRADFWLTLEDCGARAVPIVTLIAFLAGIILAFVGAVQLEQFGAEIFVADLVGIGMARAMGAMMTGIIMAGRSGAAFAAQLGTMTVNEEVDALSTLGVPPVEFLAWPRILALVLMMPLLCLYADLMGILGGAVVGVGMLDLGVMAYYQETRLALEPMDFGVGLINATVYGVLIGFAGCLRGLQCGRSAQSVGAATTSAVVLAIVLMVVATAILTVIYDVLGI